MNATTDLDAGTAAGAAVLDDCWNRIGVRGDGSCPELPRHAHCRNCPVFAAAAAALLDAPLPAHYRQDWARHFAASAAVATTDTETALVFRIGEEWLALPVTLFAEVVPLRPIHPLALRGEQVLRGLVNVRGELLPCVSLGNLLGIQGQTRGGQRARDTSFERMLVLRGEDGRYVFPVREVAGIVRFDPAALGAAPATLAGALARHTRAMLSWGERSVGCLDGALLLGALRRQLGT